MVGCLTGQRPLWELLHSRQTRYPLSPEGLIGVTVNGEARLFCVLRHADMQGENTSTRTEWGTSTWFKAISVLPLMGTQVWSTHREFTVTTFLPALEYPSVGATVKP